MNIFQSIEEAYKAGARRGFEAVEEEEAERIEEEKYREAYRQGQAEGLAERERFERQLDRRHANQTK